MNVLDKIIYFLNYINLNLLCDLIEFSYKIFNVFKIKNLVMNDM